MTHDSLSPILCDRLSYEGGIALPSPTFLNLPPEKRERFLAAARAEFARAPYDEASINRMIRAAGIPRGSFYMYFTNKEELFFYILEVYHDQLAQAAAQTLRENGGDLFAAFAQLYDRLSNPGRLENLTEMRAILQRNAGIRQGQLLHGIQLDEIVRRLFPLVDQSKLFLRNPEDLEDMFHILINVSGPALTAAAGGEGGPEARRRYLARLDILRRGMQAPQESVT